jgi:hypothetical protein
MFGIQLDRSEWILDLVSDLTGHLGPGFETIRPFELASLTLEIGGHAVERLDEASKFV